MNGQFKRQNRGLFFWTFRLCNLCNAPTLRSREVVAHPICYFQGFSFGSTSSGEMTLPCENGVTACQGTELALRRTSLGQGSFSHSIHVLDFDLHSRFRCDCCDTRTHSLQRNDVNEDIYLSTTKKAYIECKLALLTSARWISVIFVLCHSEATCVPASRSRYRSRHLELESPGHGHHDVPMCPTLADQARRID